MHGDLALQGLDVNVEGRISTAWDKIQCTNQMIGASSSASKMSDELFLFLSWLSSKPRVFSQPRARS